MNTRMPRTKRDGSGLALLYSAFDKQPQWHNYAAKRYDYCESMLKKKIPVENQVLCIHCATAPSEMRCPSH